MKRSEATKMKVLAADASTKIISVALLEDNKIKAKLHKAYLRSQGSSLIFIVKNMLDKAHCTIKEIDVFGIGLGPGSFTGLRASIASMRSLAIALNKPIIGISSFDVIAYNLTLSSQLSALSKSICVLSDARQNKVYAQFFRNVSDSKEKNAPNKVSKQLRQGHLSLRNQKRSCILDSLENVINMIKELTIIAGDGINLYKEKKIDSKEGLIEFVPEDLWYPKAEILAKLVLEKHKQGYVDDPYKVLPLYIYPKECQVNEAQTYGAK